MTEPIYEQVQMTRSKDRSRHPSAQPRSTAAQFFWSIAPAGLCVRIGVIALVGAVAHWLHATLLGGSA